MRTCWLACLVFLALSNATFAQAFKNESGDWLVISIVTGRDGERVGTISAAPKSTLVIEGGKITHGAGKFISVAGKKEAVACLVLKDPLIDFVGLDVSLLSWSAFGEPVEITLFRPVATYHLKTDKSDKMVEEALITTNTNPGYNMVKKEDAKVLNELAGKAHRTPNLVISFPIKSGGKSTSKRIGMVLSFNGCEAATPLPANARTQQHLEGAAPNTPPPAK